MFQCVKLLAILLACVSVVSAATDFVVIKESSVSDASGTITIQQPSTGAKTVELSSIYVACATCTVSFERNGTAATSTELAPVSINSGQQSIAVKAFYDSNVGVGTAISPSYSVTVRDVFDLSLVKLQGGGTYRNFTVKLTGVTGLYKVLIIGTEK